jgi:hypothetical protein
VYVQFSSPKVYHSIPGLSLWLHDPCDQVRLLLTMLQTLILDFSYCDGPQFVGRQETFVIDDELFGSLSGSLDLADKVVVMVYACRCTQFVGWQVGGRVPFAGAFRPLFVLLDAGEGARANTASGASVLWHRSVADGAERC